MRSLPLGLLLSLVACSAARPVPPLVVEGDGRSAVFHGQRWTADEGMAFLQRDGVLHLVSLTPSKPFDIVASVGADGALQWPEDARLELAPGAIRWRPPPVSPTQRIALRHLHPHEDHFHLTHLYDNRDLQALYSARGDDSPLSPIRRQIAGTLIALLIEEKVFGSTDDELGRSLARLDRILAKARAGFEAGLPAGALADIASHDFEIRDDGRTLELEGQVFRAAEGLHFAYCSGHFHIEDGTGRWAQVVEFPAAGGAFQFPASALFEARADGTVVPRPGPKAWRARLDGGQIRMVHGHWHATLEFDDPAFARLRTIATDFARPEADRSAANQALFDLMRAKLDLSDEATFEASLASLHKAASAALDSLGKAKPAKGKARPKKR